MGGCLSLLGKLEKICLLEGWQLLGIAWAVQILPAAPPPPSNDKHAKDLETGLWFGSPFIQTNGSFVT